MRMAGFLALVLAVLGAPAAQGRSYYVNQNYHLGVEAGMIFPMGEFGDFYDPTTILGLKATARDFEVSIHYGQLESEILDDARSLGYAVPDPELWLIHISARHDFHPMFHLCIGAEAAIYGDDYHEWVGENLIRTEEEQHLAVVLGTDLVLPVWRRFRVSVTPKFHYLIESEDYYATCNLGFRFALSKPD